MNIGNLELKSYFNVFGDEMPKLIVIILAVLSLGALLILFGYYAYPVPAGDSFYYLPPAINFSTGKGLVSPLVDAATALADPTGQKRFLAYPPLFPLLLSFFIPKSYPLAIFIGIALLNFLTLIFSGVLFYKVATINKPLSWFGVGAIILSLLGLAGFLNPTEGRPDILARLLIASAIPVIIYLDKKYLWLFFGLLFGLSLATSIPGAVFFAILMCIFFAVIFPPKRAILSAIGASLISLITSTVVLAVSPFGVWDSAKGALTQLINHLPPEKLDLFGTYIFNATTPFYGILMVIAFVLGVFIYRQYRNSIESSFLFLASMVLFLLFVITLIKERDGVLHYLIFLAPFLFAIVIYYLVNSASVLAKIFFVIVLLILATGFLRTGVLFPFFMDSGMKLADARLRFSELETGSNNGLLGMSGGLWTLSENYGNMYMYPLTSLPREGTKALFVQQNFSGMVVPTLLLSGCALGENFFNQEVPVVAGIRLANTMPGYGFARYDCGYDSVAGKPIKK